MHRFVIMLSKSGIKVVSWIFIFCCFVVSAMAQPGIISESEIKNQEVFIEALGLKTQGKYQLAIDKLTGLLKENPNNDQVAYEISRIYDLNKNSEKAVEYVLTAIRFNPDQLWYHLFLADLYERQNKFGAAAIAYKKASEIEPKDINLVFKNAYCLLRAGNSTEALSILNDLEAKRGYMEEISTKKLDIFMGNDMTQESVAELEKIIAHNPGNVQYLFTLSNIYRKSGDTEKQKQTYQRILEAEPGNTKASIQLATLSPSSGGSSKNTALESLSPIINDPSANPDEKIKALIPYVRALMQKPDSATAKTLVEYASILKNNHKNNAKVYALAGDIYQFTGQTDEAVNAYSDALKINKNIYQVWEQLLFLLADLNKDKELLEKTEVAMDYFPSQPNIFYLNAYAKKETGNPDGALETLDMASIMSPPDETKVNISLLRASIFEAKKNMAQAEESYKQALTVNPANGLAIIPYSRFLVTAKRNDEALKYAKQLVDSDEKRPQYIANYAYVLFKSGKQDQAKNILDKELAKNVNPAPSILECYGDLQFHLKNTENALLFWNKARASGGNSKQLLEKINKRKCDNC